MARSYLVFMKNFLKNEEGFESLKIKFDWMMQRLNNKW